MTETKTYCDVCKKEIHKNELIFGIDITRYDITNTRTYHDVCQKCMFKVLSILDDTEDIKHCLNGFYGSSCYADSDSIIYKDFNKKQEV